MQIYIKNLGRSLTPAQLTVHIQSHVSVIGLCLTPEPVAQYLFDVKNGVLRRYPIRMNTKTTLDQYTIFQDNDFENPTLPIRDRAPRISEYHSFFTANEIEEIAKADKQCPYLEGSPLSRAQQDLLYSGVVVPGFGMSFYYFLNEYILSLPNPEKALQGAITQKEVIFNDDDKQGKSALESLRYHFLAPNRIVFFDKQLCRDSSNKPTVGAILDFYIYCMQTALRKLGHETVAITDLRTYSDRSRAAKLGDLQYHFTEDEIHEPQGLSGIDDIIFRFSTLLLTPQNQTTEAVSALINDAGHSDFLEHKIALYRAITDLISAIETDSMTKIRSYLSAYDNIDAMIPREGWKHNFLPHLIKAQRALLMKLSPSEIIANDPRITDEQRTEILEKLEEGSFGGIVTGAVISLCVMNIMTIENIDLVKLHKDPINIADALCTLKRANILNEVNRAAIQAHQDLDVFVEVLNALCSRNILNQETFSAITAIREHQNIMYKIILINIEIVIQVMRYGIRFSELTALDPDKLLYVLRARDRIIRYLNETSSSFSDLMKLNLDQLNLVVRCSRGHELVKDYSISLSMLASLSLSALSRVLNFKCDHHNLSTQLRDGMWHSSLAKPIDLALKLIHSSQPDSPLMRQMMQMGGEKVQSTIRQIWKETREHNVTRNSNFFYCSNEKSYPEKTYREIQKIFTNTELSEQDKISSVIESIVLFVGNSKGTEQPFALALENKFNLGWPSVYVAPVLSQK